VIVLVDVPTTLTH